MFAAYILAHPLVLILLLVGVRWVLRIVIVPKSILFPVVLVLGVVGAYALGNAIWRPSMRSQAASSAT